VKTCTAHRTPNRWETAQADQKGGCPSGHKEGGRGSRDRAGDRSDEGLATNKFGQQKEAFHG